MKKFKSVVKSMVVRLASLFAGDLVLRYERKRNVYVVAHRGRFYSVRAIAGAAFQKLQADLPAVAAAAGTTVPAEVGEIPVNETNQHWGVQRASVLAPSLVTGNNANSTTLNLRQMRAGAAVTTNGQAAGVFATLALVTGVNLAADTPVAMTVTGTPDLVAGDVVDVQAVQIGTGLAIPDGTVVALEIS